jgi:hypothetical protein
MRSAPDKRRDAASIKNEFDPPYDQIEINEPAEQRQPD